MAEIVVPGIPFGAVFQDGEALAIDLPGAALFISEFAGTDLEFKELNPVGFLAEMAISRSAPLAITSAAELSSTLPIDFAGTADTVFVESISVFRSELLRTVVMPPARALGESSAAKRLASLDYDTNYGLSRPDGIISAADRFHLLGLYTFSAQTTDAPWPMEFRAGLISSAVIPSAFGITVRAAASAQIEWSATAESAVLHQSLVPGIPFGSLIVETARGTSTVVGAALVENVAGSVLPVESKTTFALEWGGGAAAAMEFDFAWPLEIRSGHIYRDRFPSEWGGNDILQHDKIAVGQLQWIPPTGVTSITAEGIAAGGDGAAGNTSPSSTDGSGGGAGGGGSFAKSVDIACIPGVPLDCFIAQHGSELDTWIKDSSGVIRMLARPGKNGRNFGNSAPGGAGGLAAECTFNFAAYDGGAGGDAAKGCGSGGGGSAGPDGPGRKGGATDQGGPDHHGGGGAGCNGGLATDGQKGDGQADSALRGHGGQGPGGTGGGTAGNATAIPGDDGAPGTGAGGGGGFVDNQAPVVCSDGGNGSVDASPLSAWGDPTFGPTGGSGGGGGNQNSPGAQIAGNGGHSLGLGGGGGGGGGAGFPISPVPGAGGFGGDGGIYLSFKVAVVNSLQMTERAPFDFTADVEAKRSSPIEMLSGIAINSRIPLAVLHAVHVARTMPIEFGGSGIFFSASSTMKIEWRGGAEMDYEIPLEWRGGITAATEIQPIEFGETAPFLNSVTVTIASPSMTVEIETP